MQQLSQQAIQEKLQLIDGWELDGNGIKKEWRFKDFKEAMLFVNKVAELADSQDHHPELFNVYNTVQIRYSTHDAGGLTEKDFRIATDIDGIVL